ncbi:endonuclease [Sutterella sp.]|uniref:endonuclease n=1 Tax=Sutterella sp. TaxID=1981025 RepID=UPI0026DF75C0|nr:endonuclease [Sutterella sp.]MDO5531895.1 endonuclease [Sutterella sp.]
MFRTARKIAAITALVTCAVMTAAAAHAAGNTTIESFNQAKKLLERQVYMDHRVTFYCRATFDAKKNIDLPAGFVTPEHAKRAKRVEWEHVVPAENFGRFFTEWREGDPVCVDNRGNRFKGRKCAEKANTEYRYMQSDMYNLYPAIGAVNAMRLNYNYAMLPDVKPTFGTCPMKVSGNRAEPPEYTRGAIARTTLYMADAYPKYRISRQQRQLMEAWSKMYAPDAWECTRAKRIQKIQGNENKFVTEACRRAGL